MAFLKIDDIKISGISACVPKQVEENSAYPLFNAETLQNFIKTTGVERKRISPDTICTSDMCVSAAETLITDLQWDKEDISILVLVTQTPDYIIPSTAPIIQNRLGLNKDCYTLDISLGCSGWVYGMSVISGLLKVIVSNNNKAKALLLTGDTEIRTCSKEDKSTYPLFGDAGTATALENIPGTGPIFFNMNSDGSGYEAIMIHDGGFRHPFSVHSLEKVDHGDGIISNSLQGYINGMDVFSFGIKEVPKSINKLIEEFKLNRDGIDYFLFHQANFFMNEQIRKKLKISPEKVPYSLKDFGNTSSASIPLTMATQLSNELKTKKINHIACGFGVGLSWGSVYFTTDHIICSALGEI